MLSIIQAAGWPIWLLLICSIIALALIIERAFSLRSSLILTPEIRDQAYEMIRASENHPDVLQRMRQHSALGLLYACLLEHKHENATQRQQAVEEIGATIHFQLARYIPALGTVAVIAPLLGLFGTVIGMIELFSAYSPQGGDPAALARGISMALYNTGFGILIAIPALIAHRYYRSRANYLLHRLEIEASRFNRLIEQST